MLEPTRMKTFVDDFPTATKAKADELIGQYHLDPKLVYSIIQQESGGNPYAVRYEPAWRYFWFPRENAERLMVSFDTEQALQAFSYGPMQIMGSVARQYGYLEPLQSLIFFEHGFGLPYAVQYLKTLATRYVDTESVVAAYNAGSPRKTPGGLFVNSIYVDSVMRYYRTLSAVIA